MRLINYDAVPSFRRLGMMKAYFHRYLPDLKFENADHL